MRKRLCMVMCVGVLHACQCGTSASQHQYVCGSNDDCASGFLCFEKLCISRDEFFTMKDGGGGDAGCLECPGDDGGLPDSGEDDSGVPDSGEPDGGFDAGTDDAGTGDAGPPDAGPVDAGCDAGTGLEVCGDGVDNNCNGQVDCAELSCATLLCGLNGRVCTGMTCVCGGGGGAAEASELTCNDLRDNDCDGLTDCLDSTCAGRTCGLNGRTCAGTTCMCSGNGGTAQASETTCDDAHDNDCDGQTDCSDSQCSGRACGSNGRTCAGTSCTCSGNGGTSQFNESTCDDAHDNDCDGQIDCLDSQCSGRTCGGNGRTCSGTSCTCSGNGGTAQANETACSDGHDNDCDGLTDCSDSQCSGLSCGANGRTCSGTSCTCSGNGGTAQASETICNDAHDNDCDGLVDTADPDCAAPLGDGGTYLQGTSTQPFVDACTQAGFTRRTFGDPDDDNTGAITMPFPFVFFGAPAATFWLSTNALIGFGATRNGDNDAACLPSTALVRPSIYVHFDDLITTNGLCYATIGTAPNRKLVVTWPNMDHFAYPGADMTFSAFLSETTNTIDLVYSTMNGTPNARGADSVVGIQNGAADHFSQYQCFTAGALTTGLAIRFTPQ